MDNFLDQQLEGTLSHFLPFQSKLLGSPTQIKRNPSDICQSSRALNPHRRCKLIWRYFPCIICTHHRVVFSYNQCHFTHCLIKGSGKLWHSREFLGVSGSQSRVLSVLLLCIQSGHRDLHFLCIESFRCLNSTMPSKGRAHSRDKASLHL